MPSNTHRHRARRRRAVLGSLTTAALLGGLALTNGLVADAAPEAEGVKRTQNGITLLDTLTVPAGTTEFGMPFGGLSGIDYDPQTHTYAALSDDRSENGKARFYSLQLPLKGEEFAEDKPTLDTLTVLDDTTGEPFAAKAVDPEAIRWNPDGKGLLWTSEGASASGQPAFVRETSASGAYIRELPLPKAYAPVRSESGTLTAGVRNNQALEGLTLTPDGRKVVTITENALVQDGPAAGLTAKSPSRLLVTDRRTGEAEAEHVYEVDPISAAPTAPLPAPVGTYAADRGVSEILAINKTDYLTVERSFASGVGFAIRLYWTTTRGATDVHGEAKLSGSERPMPKKLLYDFTLSGTDADNVEGITWGPTLPDGSRTLVLVADDNFGFNGSVTKFHLLSMRPEVLTGGFPAPPEQPSTVDVQLLSFNDFHGNLEPPTGRDANLGSKLDAKSTPVGGAEYLAARLKQLREGTDASLTVAAGDVIGASPFLSGLFHDEPTVESMEKLHLDVTSVGNHEFDEGTEELLRIQHGGCHPEDGCYIKDEPYDGSSFPWLAANVLDRTTGKPLLAPTWVKQVDGVKVGFIGMTLEGTSEVTGQSGIKSVRFTDEVETADSAARKLRRQGVEAIVVLLHEGGVQAGSYGQCDGISGPIVDIAKHLDPAIDAVVTGHTHQPYICSLPDPAGNPRTVTSASSFGRVVTETRLPVDRRTGDVVRDQVAAMNHLVTRTVTKNADQTAVIDKWKALSAPLANRVVGSVTADITRSETRDAESDLANLVADAQLAATSAPERGGAQIALMNPGGVRADLVHASSTGGEAPGEITYAEAFAVQPFAGSLVSVDLTGAQIEQILEEQFNDSGTRAPTLMLGVSKGLTYSFSRSAPVGDRIDPSSIKLNGEPLGPDTTYRVTANTFLAAGGDGFTTFAEGENTVGGGDDITALTDHLAAQSPVAPPGTDRVTELP
ncbi:esterase-like activity of phytase family protein [Streptomyces sp. DSM 40750]|uniref:esterase-like activity of phytase family protein n=1 Tax=Streptomyces sp. DSM 40750 TaxID=2801030 RepID=UPI00214B3165|nr:esterase-like activity of phytase family protein [Streptomyces sp. DSM 40750]UUU25471.1 esterase-like activity of phytase family protein [Streptomyces sp. DSM 40750]